MKLPARLGLYIIGAATVLTAVLSALDSLFTGEAITGGDVATDFVEMLVLSSAMVASVVVVERLRGLEKTTSTLRAEIEEAASAGRAWRSQSEHLFKGLSEAIATQFRDWELTEAEADIASLILKGLALKDIAALRETSEATIRQQAQLIYRKSGLRNRSELSAYFLEDLFDLAGTRVAMQEVSGPAH